MIGQRLAHFRVVEKIGAGGMGEVYKAHDEQLDRDVAIKVLPAGSFRDPSARARLLREARTASKLNHPHICTIYEVGEADGQAYIAMELVEGQSLSACLAAGALPPEQVLRYGLQLADALAHAHQRGIIHRDLKCANVIITPEGRAKVLDFGLAKRLTGEQLAEATTQTMDSLTGPGTVVGTLAYMAPEQLRGRPADARSDIWALGVMLYEMAAGQRPFQGKTGFELSSAILSQPPPPLPPGPGGALPPELGAVIERSLQKEPAQRYQQSSDVRAALEALQSGAALPTWPAWRYALWRRRWLALAGALVIIVVVLAVLDVGGLRQLLRGGPGGPKFESLAVLPVASLSGDAQQEYFADGMTDGLISNLSRISALRVISRTSVMRYKRAAKPLPQMARELGVDAVIQASVLREGARVRLTVQLIEATGRRLWSQRYERELAGILALQGDVTRAIAREIGVKLTPQEEARLATRRQVNPKVHEAYLKGMFFLQQETPEAIQKGMDYLHEAVVQDPVDPLAYAGLADGYITLAHFAPDPPEDALPRARAAARTALELDGTLPEAVLALGLIKGYDDWDWEGADQAIQRALQLNPSYAMAHYHLAWHRVLFGRMEEAIAEHKRAREADPLNPAHTSWLGELYRMEGRYKEALDEAQKVFELNPNDPVGHWVRGLVYVEQGMYPEAIAAIQKAAEGVPEWRWALGPVYAVAGKKDEARRVLAELNERKVTSGTALWRACTHAALGEKDEAFRWLSYEHPHIWVPWLSTNEYDLFIKPLRSDPRFQDFQRRVKLPRKP
jgi:serine/threonine-protein kinase